MSTVVYVTLSGEDKLCIFDLEAKTGRLSLMETLAVPDGPAPLAVDPAQRFLYIGQRSEPKVSSYRIEPTKGKLSLIGSLELAADPCYLATDRSGRFLFSAHYGAGCVMVHRIDEKGSVVETVQRVPTAAHAHCILPDRQNRYVFVPHTMDANVIFQFRFDEKNGHLAPNEPATLPADAGQGPRHYVYHPTKDVVYVSNENGSTVAVYRLDRSAGTLMYSQTLPTLPGGWAGSNTCAQIHIDPLGRFLYVSNRGHDSIACFVIDDTTGELVANGHQATEQVPRVFGLDPSGTFLFVAGQASGRIAGYRIDPKDGTLHLLHVYEVGERPLWVLALSL